MSDKLRQGVSVVPEFVEGETPSPAKLNVMGAQLRRASEQLEKALGDIHGESWPYLTASTTKLTGVWGKNKTTGLALSGAGERFLDIANVGRLIGPASNLNPRMLGATSVDDSVPVGAHEFGLRYKPTGTIDGTHPAFTDGTVFQTWIGTASNLLNAGDYHVTAEGKVYCVTLSNGGTATYNVDPSAWGGGQNPSGTTFNVIPDPNQLNTGVGVVVTGPNPQGEYTLTLPVCTAQQSDQSGTATVLDAEDINQGVQLEVPNVLQDNFTAGDIIPSGFLSLKNYTTGETYEDGVYQYNNASTVLVSNVDLSTEVAAGNVFAIATVGSDVTTAIDDLRQKLWHDHNRSWGEPFVQLSGISGFTTEPSNSGPWVPSAIPGNFAPQYLHRDGWNSSVDATLNDQNVMRGPLLMGRYGVAPGAAVGAGQTHEIYFGNAITYMKVNASDELEVSRNHTSVGGIRIRDQTPVANPSNNTGIRLTSNTAIRLETGYTSDAAGINLDSGGSQSTRLVKVQRIQQTVSLASLKGGPPAFQMTLDEWNGVSKEPIAVQGTVEVVITGQGTFLFPANSVKASEIVGAGVNDMEYVWMPAITKSGGLWTVKILFPIDAYGVGTNWDETGASGHLITSVIANIIVWYK